MTINCNMKHQSPSPFLTCQNPQSSLSRRSFLHRSGKGMLGTAVLGSTLTSLLPRRALAANERPHVALIGAGGRGRMVARFMVEEGADLTTVCDIHPPRRDEVVKQLAEIQGRAPKAESDYHRVLDDPQVDAVVIATPDHWHAPLSVQACQAEKDVYVEKPHAHNIWEGHQMIAAARKYRRVLQVGTQNRSAPYCHEAREYIVSGGLGSIHLVKVYNLKPGGPFHLGDPGTPPDGFDWNIWLGPAPERPYHQSIFYGGWHHFWDFSGGDMCDDGIHQFDLALMLLGNPGAPKAVACSGGRLAHRGDDSQVPDTVVATMDYDDFVLTMEHSNYPAYMRKTTGTIRRNDEFPYWTQNATRIELYGSEKMMTIGRHGGGWIVTTSGGKIVKKRFGRPSDNVHARNFLACLKSRDLPNADIATLHPSLSSLHLANIAHRNGNTKLTYDAAHEHILNNAKANNLIKREYRPEFALPEHV